MYTFDPKSDRWRNDSTGKYVSRDRALAFVEQSIGAGKESVARLAQAQADGDLSARQWLTAMREEIKGETIRQYMLGKGGRGSMEAADWGRVGGLLSEQYKYLDNFYDQVAAGEVSAAEMARRAQMYIGSAREAYERGHFEAMRSRRSQVKWNLGQTEQHCSGCTDLAAQDWMELEELPTYPCAGDTECLTNCDCYLTYQ